jgi:hypothetical protein
MLIDAERVEARLKDAMVHSYNVDRCAALQTAINIVRSEVERTKNEKED